VERETLKEALPVTSIIGFMNQAFGRALRVVLGVPLSLTACSLSEE